MGFSRRLKPPQNRLLNAALKRGSTHNPNPAPVLHLFLGPVNYLAFYDRKNTMHTRRLPHFLLGFFLLFCIPGRTIRAQTPAAAPPTVVFMTDFGVLDDSVALCKGVMYSIAPEMRIVDLTHEVTPFSILDGARFLYGASPYFPAGTVFVTVIDPGVGSTRKAVVVKTKRGQYFVLPDNGLMTLVQDRDEVEAVREITNRDWMIGAALSSTFHGRDIFSPVGAHLAHGEDWTSVGPEVDVKKLVRLDLVAPKLDERGLSGEVIATDGPYGNLVTNVSGEDFLKLGYGHGQNVHVTLGKTVMNIPFVRTFSDVPLKKPLMYIDSRGHLALAVNQGSFAATYSIKPPTPILVAGPKN
jgi:S-adenosyl-L-methionine hydrolase (adenosine-forming)